MAYGSEIYDRVEALARARGTTVTGASRDAGVSEGTLRKMRSTGAGGTLETMFAIARTLDTSVAYLIGETDDPAPSAPLRADVPARRRIARLASAGASFEVEGTPAMGVSITTEDGEQRFLLSEDLAPKFQQDVDAANRLIAEDRQRRLSASSHPPSSAS